MVFESCERKLGEGVLLKILRQSDFHEIIYNFPSAVWSQGCRRIKARAEKKRKRKRIKESGRDAVLLLYIGSAKPVPYLIIEGTNRRLERVGGIERLDRNHGYGGYSTSMVCNIRTITAVLSTNNQSNSGSQSA